MIPPDFTLSVSEEISIVESSTLTSNIGDEDWFPHFSDGSGGNYGIVVANFGQDSSFAGNKTAQGNQDGNGIGDFYYTPPTGYLALCNENLPDDNTFELDTGEKPSDHFNILTYSGTGVNPTSHTGVGFQPDFVWLKARNAADNHPVFDAIRGAGEVIYTNTNDAEGTTSHFISFDSDGFTTTADSAYNSASRTYVAWCWKANGTGVSNTNGDITSTVSANTTAGFSIVSYTGATNSTSDSSNNGGSYWTIGHGLTKAPELIIVKKRSSAASWYVGSDYLGGTTPWADGKHLTLNTTASVANEDPDGILWGNTAPTSSVFTVGGWDVVNRNGSTYISYCFHSVDGYSKVGSYTGNGSTDGPFVYTGFRPACIIYKKTSGTADWHIYDNKRDAYNVADSCLFPSGSYNDQTGDALDFLSNGFKQRNTGSEANASGSSYIYIAFAEVPTKFSNGR